MLQGGGEIFMPRAKVVRFSKEGPVGWVIVNSPPVNALSHAVRLGLKECVEQGIADKGVEAMVLICEGRTFMAGADIRELGKPKAEPLLPAVIQIIEDSPKPIIAAIHGSALGGGFEVALGCHFRIGLLSAKVGLPEVKLGLLPGAGGTTRLTELVGKGVAVELLITGRPVDAAEALSLRLVNRVLPGERLLAEALDFAADLAAGPRKAIEALKAGVLAELDGGRRAALRTEAALVGGLFGGAEAREGIAAFVAKRPPDFRSRD
jgi:3-hydroxyacyl-CoA dehydrogenase